MPEENEETQSEATETPEATEESTSTVPEWRAGLPEEVRDLEMITKFDGAENPIHSLVNGFIGAERAMGADKVVLPGKDATDEVKREFFTRLGCPETAEGYKPPTENISSHFDVELFNRLREPAHRLGVSDQQMAGLARALDAEQVGRLEQMEQHGTQQGEKWEQELRVMYGDAFEQNTELARSVATHFGGDEFIKLLDQTGLGDHPLVVDTMHKIARTMSEDEIVGGGGGQSFINTPEQAEAELAALKQDKDHMEAYGDAQHVAHAEAVARVQKLYQQMHPGG